MTKVLVVEDDPDLRSLLVEVLGPQGHTVLEAGDGRAALALLEGPDLPDVILLDMHLPIVNGRQVLHALRHQTRLAEIAVVSISGSGKDLEGADAVLRKPFGFDALFEVVARLGRGRLPRPQG